MINTLIIAPPLPITEADVDDAIAVLDEALAVSDDAMTA
jgi:taurine--2-oxoglutarate transaminase